MATTKVSIHQPNYLPWLGYFGKILDASVFVLLDTVQFSKNGYQNRVRIKGPQGRQWLTQPVRLSGIGFQDTRSVSFADERWSIKHATALQTNYGKARFFDDYFQNLASIITKPGPNLAECNERIIRWICRELGAEARIVKASELALGDCQDPTERLIRIVQAVEGDTYLSGAGGFSYQEVERFHQAGLVVEQSRGVFPDYPQLWGTFIPGLSIIDLLMNCGPESRDYLDRRQAADSSAK